MATTNLAPSAFSESTSDPIRDMIASWTNLDLMVDVVDLGLPSNRSRLTRMSLRDVKDRMEGK